jgi:hypothetical protein
MALRTALVPPEEGTFRPCERRHDASWDEDPLLLLGDAAAEAPPPDEPHAETASSMSAAPATIPLPCRLVISYCLRTDLRGRPPRPAPA